jgi:HEPN domain-containing protein
MTEKDKWMNRALHDIETAEYNLKGNILDAAAFYCQQAVEKALKALYIKEYKKLIRSHDLLFLGNKINLPDELIEICDGINPFYTGTRYPDMYEEYSEEEIEEAIIEARRVIEWVKTKI